jgi:hypothetical protein
MTHHRTNASSVMNDGGCLRGKIERGTSADDKIEHQPIRGIEPAGCRLKIKSGKIGPHPVELEGTRYMERISDMLAAEHRSSRGQFGNQ